MSINLPALIVNLVPIMGSDPGPFPRPLQYRETYETSSSDITIPVLSDGLSDCGEISQAMGRDPSPYSMTTPPCLGEVSQKLMALSFVGAPRLELRDRVYYSTSTLAAWEEALNQPHTTCPLCTKPHVHINLDSARRTFISHVATHFVRFFCNCGYGAAGTPSGDTSAALPPHSVIGTFTLWRPVATRRGVSRETWKKKLLGCALQRTKRRVPPQLLLKKRSRCTP